MIETPQVIETPSQRIACIYLKVPSVEIRNFMGPGIRELQSVLAAQNVTPTGPWFTHHFRHPTNTFDFEICLPVAAEINPSGRVKNGELAAATAAHTVYRGHYATLGKAWGELEAWIAGQGYTPAEDLWEVYTVGPESGPDPALWRTDLYKPLLR